MNKYLRIIIQSCSVVVMFLALNNAGWTLFNCVIAGYVYSHIILDLEKLWWKTYSWWNSSSPKDS